MEEKIAFMNESGEKLAGFLHRPRFATDKGVVLAHCFTCSKHIKIIREICDKLTEFGFLVLRFDFSGNGESEGKFEDATYSKEMKDLSSAIIFIQSKGAKDIGILGHSMGAAVSILESANDKRVKSLCIIAGQSDSSSIKNIFPEKVLGEIYAKGTSSVTLFGKTFTITKEFFLDSEKHNLESALRKFKRPFSVIHGDKDIIISVENAKKLYSYASEPKEIHILKGADHLFSESMQLKDVEDIVVTWFKKTL